MSLLAEQVPVNDKSIREHMLREVRGYSETLGTGLGLGPILFHNPTATPEIHGSALMRRTISSPINLSSLSFQLRERDIRQDLNTSATDWYSQVFVWKEGQQSGKGGPIALALSYYSNTDMIMPAAEEYAKSIGVYGALILTKEIVHETIPSLKALVIDVKEDPEDEGYTTVCFTITVHDSVEQVMKFDNALQDTLYERLPSQALPYFSFSYRFE